MTQQAGPANTLFKRTGSADYPLYLKCLVSGPPKSGKHLANGTPVLTPRGWVNIEDLTTNDFVIGVDGQPTRVVGVYPQGIKPMRRIITDDGASILAGDTHLWTVLPHGNSVRTQTTDEISKRMETNTRYAYLPMPEPIQFEDQLPADAIAPRALGLLLGDGCLGSGSITFTKPEPILHAELATLLPDCVVTEPYDHGKTVRINRLRPRIQALGLVVNSSEKFIPRQYIQTTIENRLALLSGLLDTDGGMNGRSVCFYTSSPDLCRDVVEVVRSLGGVATVRTQSHPGYTYCDERRTGRQAFNVAIRLPLELGCPFTLYEKIDAYHNGTQKRRPTRRFVAVDPVEDMEATCIKVEAEDGLFVTQDYIVTHNTSLLATVPNIIVLDTEPDANNLESIAHLNIPYVTIRDTQALRQVLFLLSSDQLRKQVAAQYGWEEVGGVAIDTMDTLQKIMKRERMYETHKAEFLRDDWAWLKTEMESLVAAFTKLPMHVFFTAHLKTKEIGKGEDKFAQVAVGLEGAIADSLPGLVGYSLLTFRQPVLQSDGSTKTEYFVQAEGDQNYDFLGTRTGGRLPAIITPDMAHIYNAVLEGRQQAQAEAPEPPPMQPMEIPAQILGQGSAEPEGRAGSAEQSVQQPIPPASVLDPSTNQPPVAQTAKPADSEPVNGAALTHVKRIYDAMSLPFPEDKIRELTIGDARNLVRYWAAAQQDATNGTGPEGSSPQEVMAEVLRSHDLYPDEAQIQDQQSTEGTVPRVDGTIAEVEAYIKASGEVDLARVQEAYQLEVAKDAPRKSLISKLEAYGAQLSQPQSAQPPQQPVQQAPPEPPQQPQQAPPASPESSPPQGVSPAQPNVDATTTTTMEQAVGTVGQALGGQVLAEGITPGAPCAECGKPHDDTDIAKLALMRFGKVLCIEDYVKAGQAATPAT